MTTKVYMTVAELQSKLQKYSTILINKLQIVHLTIATFVLPAVKDLLLVFPVSGFLFQAERHAYWLYRHPPAIVGFPARIQTLRNT